MTKGRNTAIRKKGKKDGRANIEREKITIRNTRGNLVSDEVERNMNVIDM